MDKAAHPSFYDLRLVHLLSNLKSAGTKVSQGHFSEKFGQLVGFSGSISLSKLHEELSEMVFNPVDISPGSTSKAIRNNFLSEHTDMVRFIALSFVPNAGRMRDKLPDPEELHSHFQLNGIYEARRKGAKKIHNAAYEPYRKFYVARQKDLEIKTKRLRSHIEGAIVHLSPELAQLSKLDAVFDNVISVRTRELFEVVPKLLGKHFGSLFDKHRTTLPKKPTVSDLEQWMQPNNWLSTFCGEMRELLLAELEVRLQPVLGMIDALP